MQVLLIFENEVTHKSLTADKICNYTNNYFYFLQMFEELFCNQRVRKLPHDTRRDAALQWNENRQLHILNTIHICYVQS